MGGLGKRIMHGTSLLWIAAALLIFSLASRRLERTFITAPMVFVALGFALGPGGFGVLHLDLEDGAFRLLGEITLALVLFTDGSRIPVKDLWKSHGIPVRLLVIGLPLSVLFGGAAAIGLMPTLTVWSAFLLAALLAPTDAALGQAVVLNPKVPTRIREGLNVESGLNDGLALPIVLFLAACASMTGDKPAGYWIQLASVQILVGGFVGVALGLGGARLLSTAFKKEWMGDRLVGLAALALGLLALAAAEAMGGNGFIAAFACGVTFGNAEHPHRLTALDFAEDEGQLLAYLIFFLFGVSMVPDALGAANLLYATYVLLSLSLVRIAATVIALLGSRLRISTMVFMGWFGPRGLASILFVVLVADETSVPDQEALRNIVSLAVLASVFLHGLTAQPGAKAYARRISRLREADKCPEEIAPHPETPLGLAARGFHGSPTETKPLHGSTSP